MDGRRLLRVCMQAIVLLNLLFVQLTGSAGLEWLVPLFALTLAVPLLARFRERIRYRALWNAGVLGLFASLLHHVTQEDLANVLEDGLVLAVLCQVHLVNNLRSNQQPDLLFFNAFLIAIVAAFMSPGAEFALVFLVFAPCFVIGLQLLSVTRAGGELTPAQTRRLALDGFKRSGVVLAASLVVFAFWPRNFERQAFFHGRIEIGSGSPDEHEVGFNEELDLDRSGDVSDSGRPVLRVTLLSGERRDVPVLWRGATLGKTEAGSWRPFEFTDWRAAGASDEPWERDGTRLSRPDKEADSGEEPAAIRVRATRLAQGTERLFTPLGARSLELAPGSSRAFLRVRMDGNLDAGELGNVAYELGLTPASAATTGGPRRERLPQELRPYVTLPHSRRIESALELATGLAAELPPEAPQAQLVARLEKHLSGTFTYILPGSEGAAESLDEFLTTDAGGHCEFFASALATMLRSQDVPCRVVTGYRSSRWENGVLEFTTSDAHAWVEVHDPTAGWYAVDPTPATGVEAGGFQLWARLQGGMGTVWKAITGFDAGRRAALVGWARALPGRALSAVVERPLRTTGVGLLCAAAIALAHGWRLRRESAVSAYRRALRKAGLRSLPGETPRELLERAGDANLKPHLLSAVQDATLEHEAARYAA